MLKLRIFYVVSLVTLGVLIALSVFLPLSTGEEFSTVTRESIINRGDEWIVQFDIINNNDEDVNYIIEWSTGGEIYSSKVVLVETTRTFTSIHHIYPGMVGDNTVNLAVREEGNPEPLEQTTFYLE